MFLNQVMNGRHRTRYLRVWLQKEREDRMIRLGCPCPDDLAEIQKKRTTLSPEQVEKPNLEFAQRWDYPDRIRLGYDD
jgi:hypothetical protein